MLIFGRVVFGLVFGGLVSLSAQAQELGPVFDCSSHISTVPPGTPCREVKNHGLPSHYGSEIVRLFRFHDTWDTHPEFEATLQQIAESARKSIEYFSQLGSVPSIHLYFINEVSTIAAAAAAWEQKPCKVSVYFGFSENADEARQTIAHEIFHCIQAQNIFLPPDYRAHHSNSWWVEGAADYFANLVYPHVNFEARNQNQYSILNPLTAQPNDYAPSLFFQFLANQGVGDPTTIMSRLRSLPHSHDPQGTLAAVSQWPQIGQLFHDFIIAVLNRTIIDTSGGSPGFPHATVNFAVLDLDPASPGPTIGVQPLRAGGGAFRLPKGSKVKLSIGPDAWAKGVRVSYRAKGGTHWTPMSPALSYEANTPCSAAHATEVEFLITSTDPEPSQMVELHQEAKAQECRCQAPQAIIDPCLVGKWEVDTEATANSLLEEFRRNDPGTGFKIDQLLVTGDAQLTIKTGRQASQHTFERFKTTSIWKHTESAARNVLSTQIDALAIVTFQQDDDQHVCISYDAADGTIVTEMNGSRRELAASEHMVGPATPIKYTCSRQKLELWYAQDQTLLPFHTYRRTP